MKPSYISVEQWKKVFKAALYVGLSAAISYVVALIAENPALFGVLTPFVNMVLVALKQLFTDPNKG